LWSKENDFAAGLGAINNFLALDRDDNSFKISENVRNHPGENIT
jgi:hypothetical protein